MSQGTESESGSPLDDVLGSVDLAPLKRMIDRAKRSRDDSEAAFFQDLLLLGELALKLVVLATVASMEPDRLNNRYRVEHKLVRADGLGDWIEALDDILIGPAGQTLRLGALPDRNALTLRHRHADANWVVRACTELYEACKGIDPTFEPPSARPQLREWLRAFVVLRNKTRGHGSVTSVQIGQVIGRLEASIAEFVANIATMKHPWAHLRRTLAGKYHVSRMTGDRVTFEYLTKFGAYALNDGVYMFVDSPALVPLMETDSDLSDFWIANGSFNGKTYEQLSYITGSRRRVSAEAYLKPPEDLPPSETQGATNLELLGKSFTNLPPETGEFVERLELENELRTAVLDARHPIVTLVGRGGIGKTSVAVHVLREIAELGEFLTIVWFSARDIDLLPEGPKAVRTQVRALDEVATEYARLMNPSEGGSREFKATEYLAAAMSGREGSERLLFVFDNFETVASPADLYAWLDTMIRLPNKVLITTRIRQFKADYPVEVAGMTRAEFDQLVDRVSGRLGIRQLIARDYRDRLFQESDGHPYVVKVLMGDVARQGKALAVDRILAGHDDMLDALFERTYNALPTGAQRVFLTLSGWRSSISLLALEACLLRPTNKRMDVRSAVDVLIQSSLVESATGDDGEEFVTLPLAAALFGRKQLTISSSKGAIDEDIDFLRGFGAAQETDIRRGLGPRLDRLAQYVQEQYSSADDELGGYRVILEFIARSYPTAWLDLAKLFAARHAIAQSREYVQRYVQAVPGDPDGWSRLAGAQRALGDGLGEIVALMELADRRKQGVSELSEIANRFNALVKERKLDVANDDARRLLDRLRKRLESRIQEAGPDDLSRLGWLCVHASDYANAQRYASLGLQQDPANIHCQRLLMRLTATKVGNRSASH